MPTKVRAKFSTQTGLNFGKIILGVYTDNSAPGTTFKFKVVSPTGTIVRDFPTPVDYTIPGSPPGGVIDAVTIDIPTTGSDWVRGTYTLVAKIGATDYSAAFYFNPSNDVNNSQVAGSDGTVAAKLTADTRCESAEVEFADTTDHTGWTVTSSVVTVQPPIIPDEPAPSPVVGNTSVLLNFEWANVGYNATLVAARNKSSDISSEWALIVYESLKASAYAWVDCGKGLCDLTPCLASMYQRANTLACSTGGWARLPEKILSDLARASLIVQLYNQEVSCDNTDAAAAYRDEFLKLFKGQCSCGCSDSTAPVPVPYSVSGGGVSGSFLKIDSPSREIDELPELLAGAVANDDQFLILDASTGQNKRISVSSVRTAVAAMLSYFAESESNGHSVFSAAGSGTNRDLVLAPKGDGALARNAQDNTIGGGNARGSYATDLQPDRANANDVASGDHSVIAGGSSNRASGSYSSVLGGLENQANGAYSTSFGLGAKANLLGESALSAGYFDTPGDCQKMTLQVRKVITGIAVTQELFLDGLSLRMLMGDTNALWAFRVTGAIVCADPGGSGAVSKMSSWTTERRGAIKKVGGSTSIIGSVSLVGTAADASMSTAAMTIDADDTNDSLRITATTPSTVAANSVFYCVATVEITKISVPA